MKKIVLLSWLILFALSCRKQPNDPLVLPDSYSNKALGASAHDLLSADKFNTINIEVQYMPGYRLDDAAITALQDFLNSLCNKTGGINIVQTQIAGNGDTLNVDEVAVIEKKSRSLYNLGKAIAIYVLVTDGYNNAAGTLGFAYRNTSICLFGKNIFTSSGGFNQVSRKILETMVLEHEMGHILGLVNLGTPMQTPHQDTVNGKHCNNEHCLMYFEIETSSSLALLFSGNIPVLDNNCRNDLSANGGK